MVRRDASGRALVDAAGAPLLYRSGHSFKLVKEPARNARSLQGAVAGNRQLRVPTERLEPPRAEIAGLRLRITGPGAERFTVAPGQRVHAPAADTRVIETGVSEPLRRVAAPRPAAAGDATALPAVRELVRRAGGTASSASARVDALMSAVRTSLRYDARAGGLDVAALLERKRADCTGYATLFTALARAAGLPARTVAGMAYTSDPAPAFALHAWSEVRIDGRWQSVDPTFGQRPADGTHVRFPTAPADQLDLALALPDLEVEVLAVRRR